LTRSGAHDWDIFGGATTLYMTVDGGSSIFSLGTTGNATLAGNLTVSGTGNLSTAGGRLSKIAVITTGTTLDTSYDTVVCNSGSAFTVTLPAGPGTGQRYLIKNKGAGLITVSGNGANLFTNTTAATMPLNTGDAVIAQYDGTVWAIL
jgi:hypothetical protein